MSYWIGDSQVEEEYNDDKSYAIEYPNKVAGSLGTSSDIDWYSFRLPKYTNITVEFKGLNYKPGTWNLSWYTSNLQNLSDINARISGIDGVDGYTYNFNSGYSDEVYYLRVKSYSAETYKGDFYFVNIDYPTPPVVSVLQAEVSYTEGDDGFIEVPITVNLSKPSSLSTVIHYSVRSGTANVGTYYDSDVVGTISGNLTFSPGETSQILTRSSIWSDTYVEPDEYYWVDFDQIAVGNAEFQNSSNILSVKVNIINDDFNTPFLLNAIADQFAIEDGFFDFSVPYNSFYDNDIWEILSYSVVLVNASGELIGSGTLPSWLTFNTQTRTFSGTPANGDVGSIHLKVTAIDSASASVSDQFELKIANTNDAPTGSVSIAGIASEGQTLTASNTLADVDGLGTVIYQWLRSSQTILGANGETYQVTQADIAQTLSVEARYTDGFGTLERVLSANASTILPQTTVNSQSVDAKGNLAGTANADVFDGAKTPTATLVGGQGDDSYLVNNIATKIKEAAKQGIDTVFSSVSFNLPSNVEKLILTGDTNIDAKGNTLDNELVGNDGDNLLFGFSGNDTLRGNAGNDRFVFDSALNAKKNVDTILDFISDEDTIALSAKVFKKLGATVDASDIWFKDSGNTQGTTGFLVYDSTTGVLAYDADGSGKKAAIQIALVGVTEHPELTASDFMII